MIIFFKDFVFIFLILTFTDKTVMFCDGCLDNCVNPINELPDDILKNILSLGTMSTHDNIHRVCHKWRKFTKIRLTFNFQKNHVLFYDYQPMCIIVTNNSSMIISSSTWQRKPLNVIFRFCLITNKAVWYILDSLHEPNDHDLNIYGKFQEIYSNLITHRFEYKMSIPSLSIHGDNFIVSNKYCTTLYMFNDQGKFLDKLSDKYMEHILKMFIYMNVCYVMCLHKVYLWKLYENTFCSKRMSNKNSRNYWKHYMKEAGDITVVNGLIYLLDSGHRSILCFKKNGELLRNINIDIDIDKLQKDIWYKPSRIISSGGLLYISYLGCVRIITHDGDLVAKIQINGVSIRNTCLYNICICNDMILVAEANHGCIYFIKQTSNYI